ncbi:MAG: hypothetical protein IM600_15435 [Bacteroidetes bacterium]|nr:hypothetical protein [Bacteroidota bacterium]MCA6444821.1 hypothetical protein [Bacteroidota bacterium]
MKIKISIIILSIITVHCKKQYKPNESTQTNVPSKDFDYINDTTKGTITVIINGNLWRGFPYADSSSNFSFTATKYRKSGENFLPMEIFSIFKIRRTTGNQIIYKSDSTLNLTPLIAKTSSFFGTFKPDGDVTCEDFSVILADSANNIIQITKQINNYSEVFGTFKLSLVKINNCSTPHYSDTLKLSNGYFHFKLK